MNRPLDAIDRRLLQLLRADARTPVAELAAALNVSSSTAHRRLRELIADGIIQGFTTVVNEAALGHPTEALINVRLNTNARGSLRQFQAYLQSLPAAKHVYFVSGNQDFIVHVAVEDPATLSEVVSEQISARDEVASTVTNLIFSSAPGV